jgi:hypothetical protein
MQRSKCIKILISAVLISCYAKACILSDTFYAPPRYEKCHPAFPIEGKQAVARILARF